MRSLGKLVVAASALALIVAVPAWAQNRTDIPDTAAASIFANQPHIEGNFLAQDQLQFNLAGIANQLRADGQNAKIVFSPSLAESVIIATIDLEPDTVVRKGGAGASGKVKSSNQAGVVILHSGGNPPNTFNATGVAVDGCKSKTKGLNLNTGSGQYQAANGVSSCSEAALTQLVPNAAARARIQEMLGTPAGQGLKAVSTNVPHVPVP